MPIYCGFLVLARTATRKLDCNFMSVISERPVNRRQLSHDVALLRSVSSLYASLAVPRLPQPGQYTLDEHHELVQRFEMRGLAAYHMFGPPAKRTVRPQRFAGELHDEGMVCREQGPLRSVRFQLMLSRGMKGSQHSSPDTMLSGRERSPEISRRFF
jgi:hypothetical protein